jgi:hypothetical protein
MVGTHSLRNLKTTRRRAGTTGSREGSAVKVVRDMLALATFLASLVLVILQILGKR